MYSYFSLTLSSDHCHRKLIKINEFGVMVLNATFNNISFISWRSVLFMEYTSPEQDSNLHRYSCDRN